MGRVAHAIRRWMRLAIAYGVLAVVAAPAAFGPAIGVVMRELGAAASEHVCKCGMPAGKCGCPECDRLEQERRHEHASERLAALKRHCDDDAPPVRFGVPLASVLAARSATAPAVPRGERLPVAAAGVPPSTSDLQPPTPPPRIASA